MNIMNKMKLFKSGVMAVSAIALLSSCGKEVSNTTGWNYNDSKNGGFEVQPYGEQETGPGLIFVEGGAFTMGQTEQDVMYEQDNMPRNVTVSSFYMDETEITNLDWREYVYWLLRVFGQSLPEVPKKALPDTLQWRDELAYNEEYVEWYFRHPAYASYPVVGVNWLQATDYCIWRTDRVNEMIMIREGILKVNPNQQDDDNFNTDAYLLNQYVGDVKGDLVNLDPNTGGFRKVVREDGILLPRYRLPTEAEWEYAAIGLIGNTIDERIIDRRIFPWNGHWVRNKDDQWQGEMMANIMRAKGDMMGVASKLNDSYDITAPVRSFWPNDYGLYHMAGNVSEWVMDVYRPLSAEDVNEFRSFRGNVFKTYAEDNADPEQYAVKDSLGRMVYREVEAEKDNLGDRRNYKKANNIDYLDGEFTSSVYFADEGYKEPAKQNSLMYENNYGENITKQGHSMVSQRTRVYKGGSWKDRTYWMGPGTRRYLSEDQSTDHIGFRCAMHRVGSQVQFSEGKGSK